jgi:hypothetical protein
LGHLMHGGVDRGDAKVVGPGGGQGALERTTDRSARSRDDDRFGRAAQKPRPLPTMSNMISLVPP